MASNAEILALLENLATLERDHGPIEHLEFAGLRYYPGKTPDFPAILGALKRLVAREQRAVELLERAYWLVEHFETATYDTKSDWGRLVRAFLAERSSE